MNFELTPCPSQIREPVMLPEKPPAPRAECARCQVAIPAAEGFQCQLAECPQPKPAVSLVISDLGSKLEFNLLNRALRDLEACIEVHGKLDDETLSVEGRSELLDEIGEWFGSHDLAPYSFEFICGQLKINPQAIRNIIRDYISGEINKLPKLCGQRLTAMDVIVIRLRIQQGHRPKDLGREFKVHPGHISELLPVWLTAS